MSKTIQSYVRELLGIVVEMQKDYPKKKFTLDGRLVGDIGEILAEQIYDLELFEGLQKDYDATSHGRRVQIKTTMKESLGYGNNVPDYYLGLRIDQNGRAEEIYNGPGVIIWEHIKHRKPPKNHLFNISIRQLKALNKDIPSYERIKKKAV